MMVLITAAGCRAVSDRPATADQSKGGSASSGSASGGGAASVGGSSSGGGSASTGGSSTTGGTCAAATSADLPDYASPATGTISGPSFNAALCAGGAFARVESAGASYDTSPFFFALSLTISAGNVAFQSPTDTAGAALNVFFGISAAAPGDYTSDTGCGTVAFTYALTATLSVDCGTGPVASPSACPAGCTATICDNCVGAGCGCWCGAPQPSFSYSAQGPSNCIGGGQTAVGSWHLTLTSVTVGGDDGGNLTYYTPHGTFAATLLGGASGTETASLSANF
jgi:hypothetical protein